MLLLFKSVLFRCASWHTFFFILILLSTKCALGYEKDFFKTIASTKEWEVLLHYEKGILGKRSLVDDNNFFLAIDGKKDPVSELYALYNNIYIQKQRGEGSAVCRFPLRAEFLARSLNLSLDDLNFEECKELQEFLEELNPKRASIIFPFYHMNGPASMFGHTLLRFDSDLESKLVSIAVTYAADYNGRDGGMLYAVKGVAGLYAGRTQVLPYHEKIREYDNINQRDIWEYELNLTEEEVRRMALHTYEIKDTWSRYYFFDENCSYNLLFLIGAARPEADLTKGFFWVIPVDTISILKEKEILGDIQFRPSQSTRMAERLKSMDSETYILAIQSLKENKLKISEELDDTQQVALLDFWIEYTQFKNRKGSLGEYSTELIDILRKRSTIPIQSHYEISVPEEPLKGHKPSKISLTSGVSGNRLFEEFRWRPALHTFDDSDVGFLQGSTLSFFDLSVRMEEKKGLYLKKLSFVDIYSLSSVTELFSPVSWKVNFGLEHIEDEDTTAGFFNPGAGKTFLLGDGLLYGLVVTKVRLSGSYDDNYSAGFGYEAGYLKSKKQLKFHLNNSIIRYFLGKDITEGDLKADIHYFLSNNIALTFGIKRAFFDKKKTETYLSLGFNL